MSLFAPSSCPSKVCSRHLRVSIRDFVMQKSWLCFKVGWGADVSWVAMFGFGRWLLSSVSIVMNDCSLGLVCAARLLSCLTLCLVMEACAAESCKKYIGSSSCWNVYANNWPCDVDSVFLWFLVFFYPSNFWSGDEQLFSHRVSSVPHWLWLLSLVADSSEPVERKSRTVGHATHEVLTSSGLDLSNRQPVAGTSGDTDIDVGQSHRLQTSAGHGPVVQLLMLYYVLTYHDFLLANLKKISKSCCLLRIFVMGKEYYYEFFCKCCWFTAADLSYHQVLTTWIARKYLAGEEIHRIATSGTLHSHNLQNLPLVLKWAFLHVLSECWSEGNWIASVHHRSATAEKWALKLTPDFLTQLLWWCM